VASGAGPGASGRRKKFRFSFLLLPAKKSLHLFLVHLQIASLLAGSNNFHASLFLILSQHLLFLSFLSHHPEQLEAHM
jgi:hypothetical protein